MLYIIHGFPVRLLAFVIRPVIFGHGKIHFAVSLPHSSTALHMLSIHTGVALTGSDLTLETI